MTSTGLHRNQTENACASLICFDQTEHLTNGGQLLCKYPVIAPVKSKTCYKRYSKKPQQSKTKIKPKNPQVKPEMRND